MKNLKPILFTALLCIAELATAQKVLFIGDSITDGNWGNPKKWNADSAERNQQDMNHIFGHGYMSLCATHFQSKYPEKEYLFYNRGISGNTLLDLEKRWKEDALDVQPDILSILIGTNDIDRFLRKHRDNPAATFDFEGWEAQYRSLLNQSRQANPNLKIVIGAPFVANTGKMKATTDFARRDSLIRTCADVAKRIAKDYNAIFLPFHEMFDRIHDDVPTSQETYWIWDGIHPTPAAHQRMADLWIKTINKRKWLK